MTTEINILLAIERRTSLDCVTHRCPRAQA